MRYLQVQFLRPGDRLEEMQEESLVFSCRSRERLPCDNINCPVSWRKKENPFGQTAVTEKWDLETAKPIGMRRWEMPAKESLARSSLINDNINQG